MKKHNLLKVIGISILIAVLLTWILPVTYFNSQLVEETRQRAGIFDVLSYATVTISYFGNICLYVLVVGGFYGVIHKIDAYRSLLDKIVKGFKGKENIFMIVVMVLFALITSMTGLSVGILFLFPFVISILLLMGYNKVTAAMTTVGAVLVGLIGSTYSYANTSQLSQVLQVEPTKEIITKFIILAVGLVILAFNVLKYAKDHRDVKNISTDPSYIPAEVKSSSVKKETVKKTATKKASKKSDTKITSKSKVRVWPLVVVFDLILLIMILSTIAWVHTFKLDIFSKATEAFLGFKIKEFKLFGSIFGNVAAFGDWSINELLITVFISSAIIALIYRVKFNDYLDNFIDGAKRAIKPAVFVALIYMVLVVVTYHPVLLTILKPILGKSSTLNVFTMSLVAFISSVFNVEITYSVTAALPYVASLITESTAYPLIAVIWQSMYGLAMLVAPTSVILMVTLSFMHISYGEWLKSVWKLFVELLVALLIIFTIIILI